ncbi:MAG: hypothetical protein Kilf2KO_29260 [Rhodospirillales bacterium]
MGIVKRKGAALAALLALAATNGLAETPDVGVAAAVNASTFSTPPGQATETLSMGKTITFMEEIETNPNGQAQVLFLDRSSLTVGPNSYVIIDEFVFDPALADGSLTMTLERGLVRYVGGQISKTGGVTIETSVATIGIRGGMAIVDKQGPDRVRVINLFGQVTATPRQGGAPLIIDDPSEFAVIEPAGITELGDIKAEVLTGLYQRFEGGSETRLINAVIEQELEKRPGSAPSAAIDAAALTSPAADPPAPQEILSDRQDALSDTVARGLQQEQVSDTQPPAVTPNPPEPPLPPDTVALSGSYNATANPYVTPSGADFSNPLAQNAKGGPSANFNRRYTGGQIVENGLLQIDSDGDGAVDLILPIAEGSFTVSLADSTSPLGPLRGSGSLETLSSQQPFFTYNLQTADGRRQVQVVGGLPSDPAIFRQDRLEVFAYALQPNQVLPFVPVGAFPNLQATELLVATAPGGGFDPVDGPYNSSVLWMAFGVEGEGADQRSILQASGGKLLDLGNGNPVLTQTVRGSVLQSGGQPGSITRSEIGLGSLVDGDGNAFYGPDGERVVLSNNGPFPLTDSDPDRQAQNINQIFTQRYDDLGGSALGFTAVAARGETSAGLGAERPSGTLTGYASGVGVSRLPGNVFSEIYILEGGPGVDGPGITFQRDSNSSSIAVAMNLTAESVITSGSAPQTARWVFGDIGAVNSAYLDSDHYAAGEAFTDKGQGFDGQVNRNDRGADGRERYGFRSYVVGQAPLGLAEAFPDSQFCSCPYLQWGFWGGEYEYDPNGPDAGRRERVHVGTWVTGERPSAADIAGLSGTATHSGHVFGTVVLGNGTQYLAPGRYDQTFNFGTDTGTFAITDFDSRDFTGGKLGKGDSGHPADFKSTTSAKGPGGFAASVRGSFYKGGGDPAAQVGGTFSVSDRASGYKASGVLAGERK